MTICMSVILGISSNLGVVVGGAVLFPASVSFAALAYSLVFVINHFHLAS